jgi:hypothetical protein
MTLDDVKGRVARLDDLSRGLAKELTLRGEFNDPLLYRERQGYKGALGRVLAGCEEARVVLPAQPVGRGWRHWTLSTGGRG